MLPSGGTRRTVVTEERMPTVPVQRRNGTPSHGSSYSSHSPRHSRAYQDGGDSEPESGNSSEGSTNGKSDSKPVLSDKVVLSVSGKKFTVNPSIFLKHPETMLGR